MLNDVGGRWNNHRMTDEHEPLNFEQEVAIHVTAELMSRGTFVPIYTQPPVDPYDLLHCESCE